MCKVVLKVVGGSQIGLTFMIHGPLDEVENSNTPPGSSFSMMTISLAVKPLFRI